MCSLKQIRVMSLCIMFILLFGCTKYYIPQESLIEVGTIPTFTSSRPVNVVNGLQGNSKKVVIGAADPYTFVGDLYEYTETAINLLKSELDNKKIKISSTAQKTIRLEVIKASLHYRAFIYQTYIALKAETGKGYAREYHVINTSGLFEKSIDSTIAKAVVAMLNDKNIIKYLTK